MTALAPDVHRIFTDDVVTKLNSKNIATIIDFMLEDTEQLINWTCLRYKDVEDAKKELLDTFGGQYKKTSDIYRWEETNLLSTGIQSLDDLLGGGLYPGQIYEICGLSASGKTQLCLTIATKIATRDKFLVHYIDSKGDFSVSRIQEILNTRKFEDKEINDTVERIKVSSVVNLKELFNLLKLMAKRARLLENESPSKIIIIDSLPIVFFKFAKSRKIHYSLNKLTNLCLYIANRCNLSVLLVNLMTQENSPTIDNVLATKENDQEAIPKPALGNYWQHVPSTRLLIERLDGECRTIAVYKSFRSETCKGCNVEITDSGVISVP